MNKMLSVLGSKLVRHRLCLKNNYLGAVMLIQTNTATTLPDMPPCNFTPEPYKGPPKEKVKQLRQKHLMPSILTYYKDPVLIHQGHMQWLWDQDGKRYLDMLGGIVTISVGHCHPTVMEALHRQSRLLWHTTNIYMHPKIHEYAEKLASKLPGNLKVVYFVNSGSEANDLAMFMARLYTGRHDIISLQHAYHGGSPYVMGLTAMSNWKFTVPTNFGVHQTMNPDVFQGIWGGSHCRDSPSQAIRSCDCSPDECRANDMYIGQLKNVIKFSMPKNGLAGFFAESIQGGGGTVQFPKDFVKKAFELVREKGGICVSDEVQSGFGRTGDHYWGFEGHGVIPDIVTTAKGIGNGFPLAAVITTPEIASAMSQANHFNTFGGNPLACAVGSSVLDVIDEDKCQQRSKDVGTYAILELCKLRDEFEIVGDVRGKGLMIGIELVKEKKTREPLSPEQTGLIWESAKNMGLLVGKGSVNGNTFRVKPPMCVTKEDVDFAVAVLRKAITDNI